MSLLWNRIGLSLLIILIGLFLWEFWVKPVSGPIYMEAVTDYRNGKYPHSLELLEHAYQIDPNNTEVLTLMGWDDLKLDRPQRGETILTRAHRLAPRATDTTLAYAYAELALHHTQQAEALLEQLRRQNVHSADTHIAWGVLYRDSGKNLEAAHEFKEALALRPKDPLARKNLEELYNTSDSQAAHIQFQPVSFPAQLTYTSRVQGQHFERLSTGAWKPVYWTGVDLTAALPGEFPVASVRHASTYAEWLKEISSLGVNTIRVSTILPPSFYRALAEFDADSSHPPLWLLQGVSFPRPPANNDFFDAAYDAACTKELTDAVDVIHGQGDVASNHLHAGGLYPNDVARWVAGFVVGNNWLSHVVIGNNQLHPGFQSYTGSYVQVPSGSPTEIFLAQMIDHLESYEQGKYNWQHPAAFLNWPTLDPMTHPTESTMVEEMAIRRGLGERFLTPPGPYDDDDSVTVDPTHLHPTAKFQAGYFADYSVFPFYPDFMNDDPGYQAVRDAQGSDPFLGYLEDLEAHTPGVPLVISDYGLPTSLGIGHFSPAGFNEGGETEVQQGNLLARMTRNIYDAGAAGGMVFEWLDEWFRRSWITRNYETPEEDKPLWTNFMDPSEYYGLMAVDPSRASVHRLDGEPVGWANLPPLYAKTDAQPSRPVGDAWDPARNLKALYVDADEGFLYLRLVVSSLDPKNTGKPDWSEANYLIGIGTDPGQAGLTYLPAIQPVRFPDGMTYAIQIAGPQLSQIWIASSYDPYKIIPVPGLPGQTLLTQKLGWKPSLTDSGTFEGQIIEPNRRRFGRDGRYFPPVRYDRGILRFGTLDPSSPDYDPLAEWYANVHTNTIDIRIPWALLNVTDPSSLKVFAGLAKDGTVLTSVTPGFEIAAFSYRPIPSADLRPLMEQGQPVTDSLPLLSSLPVMGSNVLRKYRWAGWTVPKYGMRLKASYGILRKAFQSLPPTPPALKPGGPKAERSRRVVR
jgi:tetratricopeptide (TPR) repeat protein